MRSIDLDCGIAYRRLVDWLDSELALERQADGSWMFAIDGGSSCTIAIAPLAHRKLGTVELERTSLSAEGDPSALDAFYALFTLRFISAGG